jgi:hypothetical protein
MHQHIIAVPVHLCSAFCHVLCFVSTPGKIADASSTANGDLKENLKKNHEIIQKKVQKS